MKRQEAIANCPICSHKLSITKLHCNNCEVEITGNFRLSKLNYLSKEQLMFVELFLKNQGNIKSLEKEMNISYPTVKKLLNEVLQELGYESPGEVSDTNVIVERQSILDALAKKEISFEEANEKLKNLK